MSRKCRVRAAVSIAAVIVCCGFGARVASGEDGRERERFVFFSGVDLWRQGNFAHGGMMWSPDGLDRDGFTFKAALAGGTYRYRSGALGGAQVTGREFGAQILPGWRFKRDTLEVKIFTGLEIREHHLTPDDPTARLRGHITAMRWAVDLWYEPTAASMLAADAAVSSAGASYSARGALGWRVFGKAYVGPETAAIVSDDYRQFRVGVHVTGFKANNFEWSAAAGWVSDSDHRTGAYGRIGVLTRR